MRNTFVDFITDYAKIDESVCVLTGDLGYGVLDKFYKLHPKKFFNFGINEQSMISAAAGMAHSGLKPFVYSIANFNTFRCLEQIRNDVHYMNLNVNLVTIGAGFSYGTAGYSHYLLEDISSMSTFSNIRIFSPADTIETGHALRRIVELDQPTYLRLGKGGEKDLPLQEEIDNSNKSGIETATVLFTGSIGENIYKALKLINSESNIARPISIWDLSHENLRNVLRGLSSKKIITIEEHNLRGGFGSMILETLNYLGIEKKVLRIGIENLNHQGSGNQDYLREIYGLDPKSIAAAILRFVSS